MKLLSIQETAERLGISRQTVMRLISEGALLAICLRSGRRKKLWKIRPEQLDRWIMQKEAETKKANRNF